MCRVYRLRRSNAPQPAAKDTLDEVYTYMHRTLYD